MTGQHRPLRWYHVRTPTLPKIPKWLTTDRAIVTLTLGLVVTSFLQWNVMRGQLDQMRADQLAAVRPWVHVSNIPETNFYQDPPPAFLVIRIRNAGPGPALNVVIQDTVVSVTDVDPKGHPRFPAPITHLDVLRFRGRLKDETESPKLRIPVLPAGVEYPAIRSFGGPYGPGTPSLAAIRNKAATMYVFVDLNWDDELHHHFHSTYTALLLTEQRGWAMADHGNSPE